MVFAVQGADQLLLANSGDGGGGDCNLNAPIPGGPPSGTPAHPCMARTKKIQNFFSKRSNADGQAAAQNGATSAVACAPEDECPCLDPDTCATATIMIVKNSYSRNCIEGCPNAINGTFDFNITGGSNAIPTQEIATSGSGPNGATGSASVVVVPGTYNVAEVAQGGGWQLDNSNCGESGPPNAVVVAANATVTCTFNNSWAPIVN